MNEMEMYEVIRQIKIDYALDLFYVGVMATIGLLILGSYAIKYKKYIKDTKQLDKFEEWNEKRKELVKKNTI